MGILHARDALRLCWARPWLRRLTWVLASGAVIYASSDWVVHRPFFGRWLVRRLDRTLREETGLGFEVRRLQFALLEGRIELEDFSIGGDLFQGKRLAVRADLLSLLSRTPRLREIILESPRLVLDQKHLDRIRLKEHPKSGRTPSFQVDHFMILDGIANLAEPRWGVTKGECAFRIYGTGSGPNRLQADIRVPRMALVRHGATLRGSLGLKADLSEPRLGVRDVFLRLGDTWISGLGDYEFQSGRLASHARGSLDLAELARLAGGAKAPSLGGSFAFRGSAWGAAQHPSWQLAATGKTLAARAWGVEIRQAALVLEGDSKHVALKQASLEADSGVLDLAGEWREGKGTHLEFRGSSLSLAPAAKWARMPALRSLALDMDGALRLPSAPWAPLHLDRIRMELEGAFRKGRESAGGVRAHLGGGQLRVDDLDLRMAEIQLRGSGTARLGRTCLTELTGEGTVDVDAAHVAEGLSAWKIVDLDMEGAAQARARVGWTPSRGLTLVGDVAVQNPRWHGAVADALRADVSIQDEALKVDSIQLVKGGGWGSGNLWLTWKHVPKGQDEIDMRYEAFHLPVEEGLKAADVGDLPITGVGSGWVRIHGPYDRLLMEGRAQAEQGKVYGLDIPAVSSDFAMDIEGDRLKVSDLRVAESLRQLGGGDEGPSGGLALQGGLEMDLKGETWEGFLKGQVDSEPLGLPEPRFQAHLDASLQGPWVHPMGPLPLPGLQARLTRGRVFLGEQTLEGLEASILSEADGLKAQVGMAGMSKPVLALQARRQGEALAGSLEVQVVPDSADTASFAARLSDDVLRDGCLTAAFQGIWDTRGLQWKGQVDQLVAHFDGFDLFQRQPTQLRGTEKGGWLDLQLDGKALAKPGVAAPPNAGADLRVSGGFPFSSQEPLSLRFEGAADLADLKRLDDYLTAQDQFTLWADLLPEGRATFGLLAGGTYGDPTLDGSLVLKDGRLQIRTYPQSLENLEFTLYFKGREIALLESQPLRGRLAQGELTAWGKTTWQLDGLTNYDLKADLLDFRVRDLPEGLELRGSLHAGLQGNSREGGLLKGTLQAQRVAYHADINLRDLILSSSTGGLGLLSRSAPDDPLSFIRLDLDLQLSDPWDFDTNLLKVRGTPAGSFKVLGTLAEPGLKGKMNLLPGGRLTNILPAGDIVLERGSIDFTDPRVRNPVLDLQGRVDVTPYAVTLSIRGSLDSLDMKATSTPSLRQDEITSILIYPALATTIGSGTSTQSQNVLNYGLAATSSGLLTTLAFAEFQEQVRKQFNLDRVSFSWHTGLSGTLESDVTVGKSFNLFGHRTPLVFSRRKSGELITTSGQFEWRFGNLVLQLGASQTGSDGLGVAGEIRQTWSPR